MRYYYRGRVEPVYETTDWKPNLNGIVEGELKHLDDRPFPTYWEDGGGYGFLLDFSPESGWVIVTQVQVAGLTRPVARDKHPDDEWVAVYRCPPAVRVYVPSSRVPPA